MEDRAGSQVFRCDVSPESVQQTHVAGLYLGPAALLAQQVGVAVGLLPLLLEGVGPHELPEAQVVDLLPLLLAADALLVASPSLHNTHGHSIR